jgi:transporter family protein
MWILYGLLAALTAALMTIVAKIGLNGVDSTLATAIRSGFMFVFMLITTFSLGKFKSLDHLSLKHFGWIALAAVFGALSWWFYFLGLRLTSASKLASLDRLSLPLIILASLLFFHDTLSWKLVVGGFLVTVGAILVAVA